MFYVTQIKKTIMAALSYYAAFYSFPNTSYFKNLENIDRKYNLQKCKE